MTDAPTYTIELVELSTLKPYSKNARTHSEDQVAQIAKGVQEFGWTVPALVDEKGTILAGHGRRLAAEKVYAAGGTLKLPNGVAIPRGQIPVVVARGWSTAQKRAYVIADNKIAENAGWDKEILRFEMDWLKSKDFDLDLTGFDTSGLRSIFGAGSGASDVDDIPETPRDVVTQPGDVWLLGHHRLMCGDSTNGENVAKLLAGTQPALILTDPPYCSGGFQESGKSSGSIGTRDDRMIANDTLSTRGYQALMKAVLERYDAGSLYAFTDWRMWVALFDVMESSGYGVRSMIVWDKGTPGMGRGWRMQHELVMAATKVKQPFSAKKAQGNVIQSKRTGNQLHPTEKPVDLIETILNVSDFAKTIADPFSGSGTTLMACERTGGTCFAMEMEPKFCDVIIDRWQRFTGKRATREADGVEFDALAPAPVDAV